MNLNCIDSELEQEFSKIYMGLNILTICYLVASVSFILGLKMLSDPATARSGNRIAAVGMAIGHCCYYFFIQR